MKILRKNQLQLGIQLLVIILLIRYLTIYYLDLEVALSNFEFLLSLASISLVFIGGLVLFTVVKQEKYPEKKLIKNTEKAFYLYIGLNTVGIGISFFLANELGKVGYFGFYLALAALLYLYITQWMRIPLLSNIIFASIGTYPIFIGIVLDFLPKIESNFNLISYENLFTILFYFTVLFTILLFIKTLILDLKYVEDDKENNKKTLATIHGIKKGAVRTSFLILIPIFLIAYFVFENFNNLKLTSLYCIFALILPLLISFFQLNKAKNIKEFNTSNAIINVIIWLTIISIVFLFFNIKNNVAL